MATLIRPSPTDMRQGVIWAYRLLLGREADDEASVDIHLRAHHSIESLRAAFMATPEFNQASAAVLPQLPTLTPTDRAVVARFQPFCTEPGAPGFWHDFLGVRTRCAYLPDDHIWLSETVQGPPGTPNSPLHEAAEWIGTLRSVVEARDRLVAVELGAGWAPWLVGSAKAAAHVGIQDVVLIGVEGSAGHCAFMRQHLLDNGIDPARHRLLHAVVGARDGIARFPRLERPNSVYGSQALFGAGGDPGMDGSGMEEVPSLSLETLLADVERVDILHCDVQGSEAEVFSAGAAVADAKVRRVVIGTHSRAVEAELLDVFSRLGWALEDDSVCKLLQTPDGSLMLLADGCQVWRNRAFDPR